MNMPLKSAPSPKPTGAMGDAMGDTGMVKLNVKDYPALQGVQQGQKVTGSFEATVDSIEGDAVSLSFESIDMNAENSADRALSNMRGKPSMPQQSGGDEEDSY